MRNKPPSASGVFILYMTAQQFASETLEKLNVTHPPGINCEYRPAINNSDMVEVIDNNFISSYELLDNLHVDNDKANISSSQDFDLSN